MAVNIKSMPLDTYAITSKFGPRYLDGVYAFHYGLDISATVGQNVYTVQKGVVKSINYDTDGYGTWIVIEHTDYGFCTLYGHLLSVSVVAGQSVSAGQIIGRADNTGHSFGSHLHIEVIIAKYLVAFGVGYKTRVEKYNVDPQQYLDYVNNSESGGVSFGKSIEEIRAADVQVDVVGDGNIGAILFKRKYRIIISDDNGNGLDVSDLHIIFDCHKTITLDNSSSVVKIYNLNSDTESRIIQFATHLTIEAGYDGLYGLIFEGDIIQGIRYKENATDMVLEVVALDGDRLQSSGFNSLSIIRGQTKRDMIETVISGFGATVNMTDDLDDVKYPRGKVVFSGTQDFLQNIMETQNGFAYIEDNVVNLVKLSDLPKNEIIKLDYSSGLISVPSQSSNQVSFKALINPRIKLNTLVQIDNTLIKEQMYADGADLYRLDADGVYRIIEIDFSGDTRGDDWYITCGAASQAGAIPALLAKENSSVY